MCNTVKEKKAYEHNLIAKSEIPVNLVTFFPLVLLQYSLAFGRGRGSRNKNNLQISTTSL